MRAKTILNLIEKFKSFVYGKTYFKAKEYRSPLITELVSSKNNDSLCCDCEEPWSTYDKAACNSCILLSVCLRHRPQKVIQFMLPAKHRSMDFPINRNIKINLMEAQ